MTLAEMAEEYRADALRLRARGAELTKACGTEKLSETEKIILRRRICILNTMERDLTATARYLKNYYGRNGDDGDGTAEGNEKTGVSCAETVCEAC